jgi:hypothetical protein
MGLFTLIIMILSHYRYRTVTVPLPTVLNVTKRYQRFQRYKRYQALTT